MRRVGAVEPCSKPHQCLRGSGLYNIPTALNQGVWRAVMEGGRERARKGER
jgi:hypothetical protein